MKLIPSIRQLPCLLALHEHGSFGSAAAASFVSQSALLTSIAELERILGVVLVDRSKRHVRFTSVGEGIVARARQMVCAADHLHLVAICARNAGLGYTLIPQMAIDAAILDHMRVEMRPAEGYTRSDGWP